MRFLELSIDLIVLLAGGGQIFTERKTQRSRVRMKS
jgi:hypothetical protein